MNCNYHESKDKRIRLRARGKNSKIHADHIKPKIFFPELALKASNIQTLCKQCNFKKSTNVIDYRPEFYKNKDENYFRTKMDFRYSDTSSKFYKKINYLS